MEFSPSSSVHFYVDSRSAILSLHNPFNCPDPLFSEIYTNYWSYPIRTTFCWIPSHKGLKGNGVADFLAKAGASSSDISIPLDRPLFQSKGVLKTKLKATLQAHLQSTWEEAVAARPQTASLIPDFASLEAYRRLSSPAFMVNRLISGHIHY